jgi:hypothetical protein
VRKASNHARMWLLPWVPQLTSPERWNSLAVSRFEQSYGEPPEDWVLRVADDAPPRARLVAALPAGLLRALDQVARPGSIVIGLLEGVSRLIAREPAFHGCVAEVGPDSASLLMICRGELRRVRCRRFEHLEEVSAAARSEWASACASDDEAEKSGKPTPSVATWGGGGAAAAALSCALGGSRVLELA